MAGSLHGMSTLGGVPPGSPTSTPRDPPTIEVYVGAAKSTRCSNVMGHRGGASSTSRGGALVANSTVHPCTRSSMNATSTSTSPSRRHVLQPAARCCYGARYDERRSPALRAAGRTCHPSWASPASLRYLIVSRQPSSPTPRGRLSSSPPGHRRLRVRDVHTYNGVPRAPVVIVRLRTPPAVRSLDLRRPAGE